MHEKELEEKAIKMIENWIKELKPQCEIEDWGYNLDFGEHKIRLRIEGKIKLIKLPREKFDDVRDCKNWKTSYGQDLKQNVKQHLKNQLKN